MACGTRRHEDCFKTLSTEAVSHDRQHRSRGRSVAGPGVATGCKRPTRRNDCPEAAARCGRTGKLWGSNRERRQLSPSH
jgi:hypothetical protein